MSAIVDRPRSTTRENADTCANNLLSKRDYVDYPTAFTEDGRSLRRSSTPHGDIW